MGLQKNNARVCFKSFIIAGGFGTVIGAKSIKNTAKLTYLPNKLFNAVRSTMNSENQKQVFNYMQMLIILTVIWL